MSEQNPAETPQQQQTEVHVDDSATLPSYSNFCRVTATPTCFRSKCRSMEVAF